MPSPPDPLAVYRRMTDDVRKIAARILTPQERRQVRYHSDLGLPDVDCPESIREKLVVALIADWKSPSR